MSAVKRRISGASTVHVRGVCAALFLLSGAGACGNLVGGVEVVATHSRPDQDAGQDSPGREPPATACQSGDARCQGPVLQACEADGSGWKSRARCASALLCVAGPGELSRCVEPSCQPGITCAAEQLQQCNVDLTGYDPVQTCASAAHCDPVQGACQDAPCVPGQISCNGPVLRRCNAARTGHEDLATCESPALCNDLVTGTCAADLVSCDLMGAVCPLPQCRVGELRCAGARLEVCNPGRNGWDFVDECATPGVCALTLENPVAVSCVEPPCDDGDVICSAQGARMACNVERSDYSVQLSQCRSANFCTAAGCEADPCSVGALSCNGTTLQVCEEGAGGGDVTRVAVADCFTTELCQAALARGVVVPQTCVPPACAAGEFRCAGRQMQACNAGRTDFVNRELCATDGLCEAGAGLGGCPVPCSGFACDDSVLTGCNAGLTGRVDLEDCGTAGECDSVIGRCADPCVPGELRCNLTALEECRDPLAGWQRLQTCETAGLCAASVTQARASCELRRCAPGQHRCDGQRLEVCKADLTGFELVRTCGGGETCDAPNQQCDICAPSSVNCQGDVFSRCAANGQQRSEQQCGAGLCAARGNNVGCLQCPVANGFRCDNQGSLFQCSADQAQENQLTACRTPQLCHAELGQCLECDPPGSSRCSGNQVRSCSAQHLESTSAVCASADLCRGVGASSAACDPSPCTGSFQCTTQGEVLVCNPGQTGYVPQNPRVFCDTTSLCDVTVADGCRPPACGASQHQCNGQVLEVCNDGLTGFRAQETCDTAAGFSCRASGGTASCGCSPESYRCVSGAGLQKCSAEGTAFEAVSGGRECSGSTRVSCSGTTLVQNACRGSAHCLASNAATCAECVTDSECTDALFCNGLETCNTATHLCQPAAAAPCPGDAVFCNGVESCSEALDACQSGGDPCGNGQVCAEGSSRCVACLEDPDCQAGQVCSGNVCTAGPADGGT